MMWPGMQPPLTAAPVAEVISRSKKETLVKLTCPTARGTGQTTTAGNHLVSNGHCLPTGIQQCTPPV